MQHISNPNIVYQFRSTTITQLLRKCGENWCTASAGAILDFRSFILANIKPPLPGMKKRQNLRWTSVDHSPTMYLENEEKERWYIFAFIRFRVVSCGFQDGGLQVHLGAVQEEAERCDALPAPHQVLAVSPAHKGELDLLLPFIKMQWGYVVLQFLAPKLFRQSGCQWCQTAQFTELWEKYLCFETDVRIFLFMWTIIIAGAPCS